MKYQYIKMIFKKNKVMEKVDLSKMKGLEELSFNEIVDYNGGESLWYWIGYGVGAAGRGIRYVWGKHTEMIMEQRGHISTMPFK